MKRKICDVLVVIYMLCLLVYMNVGNLFRLYQMYTTKEISECLIYFGIIGVIIYVLYKIINKIKFDIYDGLIFLLIVFGIISVVCAVDSDVALYGFDGRYEGLLQICTYYILFLNCKNLDNKLCKKILVWLIIVLGCIQAIYGIFQFFDIKMIFHHGIVRRRFYSTGFEVNPNFFGTVMILCFSLSLSKYVFNKKIIVSLFALVTFLVLFTGLLCSGAMSAVVALVIVVLFMIALILVSKLNIWWTLGRTILILILCFFAYREFNIYDKGYYWSQTKKSAYEIGETIKGDTEPIYGSGRIHIWTETLKVVPDNLWNGVGIDNFMYAFGEHKLLIDVNSKLAVDKAHNEYLQKLVTEGMFSFVIYMVLIFMLFIKSLIKIFKCRGKNDTLFLSLFLAFIAYCVQAFFNISVITVSPLFYIVMGLLCSLIKKVENETVK